MNRASLSVVATDHPTLLVGARRRSSSSASASGTNTNSTTSFTSRTQMGTMDDEEGQESEELWEEVPMIPDGGIGWVVAFASLMNNFVLDGVSFSYSGLADSIQKANKDISSFQFHLCGSVLLGSTLTMGPLASMLGTRFGARVVSICGSLLAGTGFLIAGCTSSIPEFYTLLIGFGVLGGIGFGFMFTSSIVVLAKFFKDNLPLATGIATTGSAVGAVICPFILKLTTSAWGWRGGLLSLGIACFLSVGFGSLYFKQPKTVHKRHRASLIVTSVSSNKNLRQSLMKLLISPTFEIISIAGAITVLAYFVPSAFIGVLAKHHPSASPVNHSMGHLELKLNTDNQTDFETNQNSDEGTDSSLQIIIGASNVIGRIAFGFLANSKRAKYALLLTNIAMTVGGLATMAVSFAPNYGALVAYAIIFGQVLGVYATLRSVIIYQFLGKEAFDVGFGVSLLYMGISLYFGNTLAGLLLDYTGSAETTFIVAGSFLLLSGIICYPLRLIYNWEEARSRQVESRS